MSRAYSGAYAIAQTGAGPSSCSMGVTSAKAAAKEAMLRSVCPVERRAAVCVARLCKGQ